MVSGEGPTNCPTHVSLASDQLVLQVLQGRCWGRAVIAGGLAYGRSTVATAPRKLVDSTNENAGTAPPGIPSS